MIKDSLHLGSRIPESDLKATKTGKHTLVDPCFASISRLHLFLLRLKYRRFEFIPLTAHQFLDDAIGNGVKYRTIRLDAPYVGIIGEKSDFGSLCEKMKMVLADGGRIEIVTEFKPDETGITHRYGSEDDPGALYKVLRGRGFNQLSDEEKEFVRLNSREEKTANIVRELERAGFKVKFNETKNPKIITRSKTAMKKKRRGNKIYLVVAIKK